MRRFLYVFAPVFLLALFLASINLLTRRSVVSVGRSPPLAPTMERIARPDVRSSPATAEPSPTAQASPSPTFTPSPTLSLTFAIRLLGPPPASRFEKGAPVSFYWSWPQPLAENQQFVLYLVAEQQEISLGAVFEPNIGQNYHRGVVLDNLEPGAYYWQARLEQITPPAILAESELRPLLIVTRSEKRTN